MTMFGHGHGETEHTMAVLSIAGLKLAHFQRFKIDSPWLF